MHNMGKTHIYTKNIRQLKYSCKTNDMKRSLFFYYFIQLNLKN